MRPKSLIIESQSIVSIPMRNTFSRRRAIQPYFRFRTKFLVLSLVIVSAYYLFSTYSTEDPMPGKPEEGTPKEGTSEEGTPKENKSEEGTPKEGKSEEGVKEEKPEEEDKSAGAGFGNF